MILRSVRVAGYRCFRNPVEVGPFGEGLNMIFGPNETGKSTLVEAIARALFERHRAGGRDLDALRPWQAPDLVPEVVVEFEAGERGYRLTKRFLTQPAVTLQRREQPRWVAFSEGDAADDWLRDLLHATAPGRGPSKPEHWGLARALWVLQVPEGGSLEVPESVRQQISRVLPEAQAATSRLDLLLEGLQQHYEQYFTPAGRVRSGAQSSFTPLVEELARLEGDLQQARADYDRALEAAEALKRVAFELGELERERGKLEADLQRHQQAGGELERLRAEVQGREQQVQTGREQLQEAQQRYRDYERLRQAAAELAVQLEQEQRRLQTKAVDRAAAEREEAARSATLRQTEERWRQADADHRAGQRVERLRGGLERRQRLDEQIQRVTQLTEQREAAERGLAAQAAPTSAQVRQAREWEAELTALRAQLQAVGLRLEVTLERDQTVLVHTEGEPEQWKGQAGETRAWSGGASAKLQFPGLAAVQVRSAAEEPGQLEERLRKQSQELADLLEQFQAPDAEALLRLQLAHAEAKHEIGRLEKSLRQALDPHADAEELRRTRAALEGELGAQLEQLDLEEGTLLATPATDLGELETEREQADVARREATERLQACRDSLAEQREQETELTAECAQLQSRQREQSARAEQILESAGCRTAPELETQATQRAERLRELEVDLGQLQERLPTPEQDPQRLQETVRQALQDTEGAREKLRESRAAAQLRLDEAQRVGRWELIGDLEERRAETQRRLAELQRTAYAVRLLRDLLREHQTSAMAPALPDLGQRVSRMMLAITGRRREVRLTSELAVETVSAEAYEVGYEDGASFSGGTREQMALAVRIALGEAYAQDRERVAMVLDDALLYTDPYRHERVKEVLRRAAERLQIFLLTSHPDRYRGLVPTPFQFDLAALVAGEPDGR